MSSNLMKEIQKAQRDRAWAEINKLAKLMAEDKSELWIVDNCPPEAAYIEFEDGSIARRIEHNGP